MTPLDPDPLPEVRPPNPLFTTPRLMEEARRAGRFRGIDLAALDPDPLTLPETAGRYRHTRHGAEALHRSRKHPRPDDPLPLASRPGLVVVALAITVFLVIVGVALVWKS